MPYPQAQRIMCRYGDRMAAGGARPLLWLLEHPHLYTCGPRSRSADILEPTRLPIFATNRGGEVTYHGPGQRIVYACLDVRQLTGGDMRAFVRRMETCVIDALDRLGVRGWSDPTRPGGWVKKSDAPEERAKIAAIGLQVRRGISRHGIALNVDPDLSHFEAIVPCGLADSAVTSLADLGIATDTQTVDRLLCQAFSEWLGPLDMR